MTLMFMGILVILLKIIIKRPEMSLHPTIYHRIIICSKESIEIYFIPF